MNVQARQKWLVVFLCWTALALVFASQSYIYGIVTGEDKDWSRVFWWSLADWYLWALLSPLIFWLADRFRFERETWKVALGAHFFAAVLSSLVQLFLQSIVQCFTAWSHIAGNSLFDVFGFLLTKKMHLNLLTYAGIVGVSHAAFYYRSNQERKAESHRLEAEKHQLAAQLAGAELSALQMQLNPHFLFNALNTLSEMIHQNPKAADKMVARLGDLLRLSLERGREAEVTLEKELEFLGKYLEIEELRFHDRLSVFYDIAPETLAARVPNLILQPLVENAVKHGVAAVPGKGGIEISARRERDKLKLAVRDNGMGLRPDWESSAPAERERIGISNTRARLRQLYDGNSSFEIMGSATGGTEVKIEIPFRTETDDESAE